MSVDCQAPYCRKSRPLRGRKATLPQWGACSIVLNALGRRVTLTVAQRDMIRQGRWEVGDVVAGRAR
jgi:hypothetical protein